MSFQAIMPAVSPVESATDSSATTKRKPETVFTVQQAKGQGRKLVSLTCYDYSTARILDKAGVDILLVGDSLAMTVLGHPNTLSVTMDEMLHHAKAVVRGTQSAMVVADMPFMSYQTEHSQSVHNAGRFIQEAGVTAVKLEGARRRTFALVTHLTEIGIPVMGHLGFTPQSVKAFGGFKVQGKSVAAAKQLLEDAIALQQAGAFAIVLEMVPHEVATMVTQKLDIPTIGIGAGAGCDGQVLVVDDFLGRYGELSPRFARRYVESDVLIKDAVQAYRDDIAHGRFPNTSQEAFAFPELEREDLSRLFSTLGPKS